jgi:hypothetical protein
MPSCEVPSQLQTSDIALRAVQLQAFDWPSSAMNCAAQVHYPVRISGFGRLAMRRDVQRLFADCNVQADDVRCNLHAAAAEHG